MAACWSTNYTGDNKTCGNIHAFTGLENILIYNFLNQTLGNKFIISARKYVLIQ